MRAETELGLSSLEIKKDKTGIWSYTICTVWFFKQRDMEVYSRGICKMKTGLETVGTIISLHRNPAITVI